MVEFTVVENDLEIEAGVSGERFLIDGGLEALVHGRDVFFRNVAVDDAGFEDEAGAGFTGLDGVVDLRELAGAAGLLLVGVALK